MDLKENQIHFPIFHCVSFIISVGLRAISHCSFIAQELPVAPPHPNPQVGRLNHLSLIKFPLPGSKHAFLYQASLKLLLKQQ